MKRSVQKKLGAMGLLKNGQLVTFSPENVARIPHKDGHYEFYHDGKLIYIGVAGGFDNGIGDLHHRLQAYQEKDNYQMNGGHHSKIPLRKFLENHQGQIKIKVFAESIKQARLHEHQKKQNATFNQDSTKNEEKNHGVTEHHVVI